MLTKHGVKRLFGRLFLTRATSGVAGMLLRCQRLTDGQASTMLHLLMVLGVHTLALTSCMMLTSQVTSVVMVLWLQHVFQSQNLTVSVKRKAVISRTVGSKALLLMHGLLILIMLSIWVLLLQNRKVTQFMTRTALSVSTHLPRNL